MEVEHHELREVDECRHWLLPLYVFRQTESPVNHLLNPVNSVNDDGFSLWAQS